MNSGKSFSDATVGDVAGLVVKMPAQVQKSARIGDAIKLMLESPSRQVYVIDVEGNLVGIMTMEKILKLIGYRAGEREDRNIELSQFLCDALKENVEEVVVLVKAVKMETKLTEALRMMIEYHLNDLPVVDDDYKLIGELSSLELFAKGKDLFDG